MVTRDYYKLEFQAGERIDTTGSKKTAATSFAMLFSLECGKEMKAD